MTRKRVIASPHIVETPADRWQQVLRKFIRYPFMLVLTLCTFAVTLWAFMQPGSIFLEDGAIVLWVILFFYYSDRLIYLMLDSFRLERFRRHLSFILDENPICIWTIISIIVLSLVLIVIENVFVLNDRWTLCLRVADDIILLLFLLEFYLRYIAAGEDKVRHLLRSDSIIDLLALFPLLRVFRLMRFIRLLRFLRVARLKRLFHALSESMVSLAALWSENVFNFVIIFIMSAVFLIFGSISIYHIERDHPHTIHSISDAVWWSVSVVFSGQPLTDIHNGPSRVLGAVLILSGVIITSILTGTVAATLSDRLRAIKKGYARYSFRDHIIICGWRKEVPELVALLQQHMGKKRKHIVVIDDAMEELPSTGRDVYFISGSPISEQVLLKGNAQHASAAIVLSTGDNGLISDQKAILATLAVESVARSRSDRDIHTCTELLNGEHSRNLERAYVNEMIIVDEHTQDIIAQSALFPGLIDFFNELLTNEKGENNIYKIVGHRFTGRCFADVFMELSDVNIIPIAVLREEGQVDGEGNPLVDEMGTLEVEFRLFLNPPGDEFIISGDDMIFVIARPEDIKGMEVARE